MTVCQLGEVPDSHRKAQSSMRKFFEERDDLVVTTAMLGRRPALLATTAAGLLQAAPGGLSGIESRSPWSAVIDVQHQGTQLLLETTSFGRQLFDLDNAQEAAAFAVNAIAAREAATSAPPPAAPVPATTQVLVVTTNDVPGQDITAVHGDVFGLVVRSRSIAGNALAGFQSILGGEIEAYTALLAQSRNDARERLAREALNRGGNAVIAFRFDSSQLGGTMTQIAAYGTAVTIRPRTAAEAVDRSGT